MNEPIFYLIWSNEHRAWWAPNECGYELTPQKAGRYTLEEASKICASAFYSPKLRIPPETIIPESALTK